MQLRTPCFLSFIFLALVPVGWGQGFTVLYDFGSGGNQDPVEPTYSGTIAQGRDGNLYSTAPLQLNGDGAIFSITPTGALTVVYGFSNGSSGSEPHSGLVLGTDGYFYGSTSQGANGFGAIFASQPEDLNVLYAFTGGSDGGKALAPPIQGSDGGFYGTTSGVGSKAPYGTLYKVTPTGILTTLYQFDQQHGSSPYTPLVEGYDGNFYGVTPLGGNLNLGIVYKITPRGKFYVLYNFDGPHGSQPFGPLVLGTDGNFYGTTFSGGAHRSGVVFRISPDGRLKVIHNFSGSGGGFYPVASLVLASDGNFYGTTYSGGPVDAGTIFKLSPQGAYNVVHRFDKTDGQSPLVTLVQHTNGILYGDTPQGGTVACYPNNCGTFFAVDLGLPPFVSLMPTSGKVGDKVEMLGQGFTGTTGVEFNGVAAIFDVTSDTFLTATVPSGATTGFVTVTKPGEKLKSKIKFRVTNSPGNYARRR